MRICMKKSISLFSILTFCSLACFAYEIPSSIFARYKQIVDIVRQNNASKLAALIVYPLKRENPLPDIENPNEFEAYYPIIFDQAFRKKLDRYCPDCVFENNGFYGLVGGEFTGDIWLNDEGRITAINYLSTEESRLKNKLTAKIQNGVHPSVREWKENVLVGKSDNLTIRLDRTERGLRYVSWSKVNSMAEKPDLILFGGVEEAQGTMGGWTWTFKNENWEYVIDDIQMCEKEEYCGLFLRLFLSGVEKSSIRLKEVK
jgi:hypothetical protein